MSTVPAAPECAPPSALPLRSGPSVPTRTPGRGSNRLQCLSTLRDVERNAGELEELRRRSRDKSSVISLPSWLAARHTPAGWVPRTFVLRSETGGRLEAALFLLEKTVGGLPTGYFRGGDALGETLLLCDAGREQELRDRVLDLVLRSHRAFLVLLDEPPDAPAPEFAGSNYRVHARPDTLHWQHQLQPTFDETLASFGHRTRRNLRYSLRRVEKNGWKFLPDLSARELIAAVAHLSIHSTHPFPPDITAMRLRLAAETPGTFAMGLLDSNGRWLSCLIGRRLADATEVFWQANAAGFVTDSLCVTMRALFMREEVRRGSDLTSQNGPKLVRYIGGTCPFMQHCCTPSGARQTSILRAGLRGALVRAALHTPFASAEHPLRAHF
jgi:hypothetical protein